jgi:DNA repair exonuclease SbcCD nuclease subunit
MFDTSRPSPQVIAAAQEAIEDEEIEKVLMVGNHDKSSTEGGDHALGPMRPMPSRLVQFPELVTIGDVDLLCIPFMPGPAKTWFEAAVAKIAQGSKRKRVLAFHLGIEDSGTPSYLRGAPDSIHVDIVRKVMRDHSIGYAFCGNWHNRQDWSLNNTDEREVVQCGTLIPTGFDNPGRDHYGFLHVFDMNERGEMSAEAIEIPGPRFLILKDEIGKRTEAAAMIDELNAEGHTVYVKWKTTAKLRPEIAALCAGWQNDGLIKGWEIAIDADESVDKAARKAAKKARKAENLAEALAKFVQALPLEEGIDRAEVLSRAQAYLGGV